MRAAAELAVAVVEGAEEWWWVTVVAAAVATPALALALVWLRRAVKRKGLPAAPDVTQTERMEQAVLVLVRVVWQWQ